VDNRDAVIPGTYTDTFVSSCARVRTPTVRSARKNAVALGLLRELPDGRLLVVGVEDKHPQLKWNNSDAEGTFVPAPSPSYLTEPIQPIIPNAGGENGEGVSDEQRTEHQRRVSVVLDSWKRLCEAHGKKRIAGEMDASVLLQAWPEFSPVRFEKVIKHHWSPKGGMKVRSDCLTLKSIASNWPEIEARYEEDAEIKAEADKGTRL